MAGAVPWQRALGNRREQCSLAPVSVQAGPTRLVGERMRWGFGASRSASWLMVAAALLIVMPVRWVSAQSPRPGLMTGLELTPQQQADVRALGVRTAAARSAVLGRHPGRGITVADVTELRRIGAEHNREMLALLTPVQRERLSANVEIISKWLIERRRASASARPKSSAQVPAGGQR